MSTMQRRDLLSQGAAAVGALAWGGSAGGSGRATPTDDIGWFSVRGFGAKGNGEADDAPAIQRAVDAANRSGGVVHFPTGIYNLESPLVLAKLRNVTIRGDGRGSVLKAPPVVSFVILGIE